MNPQYGKKRHNGCYNRGKRRFDDEPITSFGLVLFHKLPSGEFQFLLQQRRDTFEYTDFVLGMWKSEGQLSTLFTLMSAEERCRIREFTFPELWDDLFINRNSKLYHEFYPKAKRKYESVHHLIPNILDTTQTYTDEPPWGFPKGKKNYFHETEAECAVRETEEETRIDRKDIIVLAMYKYSEKFQGTNGKTYATYYFLAEIKSRQLPTKISTPHCIRKDTISDEARAIVWVPYTEACKYINPRRQLILREALRSVQKFYMSNYKNISEDQ